MADTKTKDEVKVTTTESPSILDAIVSEMKMQPADDGYEGARDGVQLLIGQLLERRKPGQRVDRKLVDAMIAEIDRRIGRQVDAILHHPDFQKMESAWRGLKFLVDRTDFRQNVRIDLMQARKEELVDDFEDASEIMTSGLYRHVYTAEYGQFGGKPYGAMVANYEFGIGSTDLQLLRNCAAVASMAHAPFLTAASPDIFDPSARDFRTLPHLKDIESLFEGPRYIKWRSLRDAEDSRYLGLCMPRMLLRAPFKAEEGLTRTFAYTEEVGEVHNNFLWGNAAFALASRVSDAFAQFRWAANIIGPQAGGAVEDLPIHTYEAMGEIRTKIPTEVLISERREYELSEAGFIALTMRKDSDNAAFFSANSAQKPKFYGISEKGKDAETNSRLGTQLPYLFIVSRLAHYIKVLQREHIGSWKERKDLENELRTWISQFVLNQDDPPMHFRSFRPLRQAQIDVEDVPGQPGWYKVDMKVRPHFKYMGAFFTLSLVGKLDKE